MTPHKMPDNVPESPSSKKTSTTSIQPGRSRHIISARKNEANKQEEDDHHHDHVEAPNDDEQRTAVPLEKHLACCPSFAKTSRASKIPQYYSTPPSPNGPVEHPSRTHLVDDNTDEQHSKFRERSPDGAHKHRMQQQPQQLQPRQQRQRIGVNEQQEDPLPSSSAAAVRLGNVAQRPKASEGHQKLQQQRQQQQQQQQQQRDRMGKSNVSSRKQASHLWPAAALAVKSPTTTAMSALPSNKRHIDGNTTTDHRSTTRASAVKAAAAEAIEGGVADNPIGGRHVHESRKKQEDRKEEPQLIKAKGRASRPSAESKSLVPVSIPKTNQQRQQQQQQQASKQQPERRTKTLLPGRTNSNEPHRARDSPAATMLSDRRKLFASATAFISANKTASKAASAATTTTTTTRNAKSSNKRRPQQQTQSVSNSSLERPLSFHSNELQSTRRDHKLTPTDHTDSNLLTDSSTLIQQQLIQQSRNHQLKHQSPTEEDKVNCKSGNIHLAHPSQVNLSNNRSNPLSSNKYHNTNLNQGLESDQSALFLLSSNHIRYKSDITTNNINNMADQAVIDKLEAGFAKLQAASPEQCHSLLKKYLTREVLDKLKTKKTAMGATLLDVCQSGFENLDSGVGIYAPDAESYTLFADLFNPIIEDYHGGFKSTDKHPPSDFGVLDSLVDVDPNNEYVISTRVRCGRSLKGYPFNPCLTEAQYKEMEQKVSTTLKEVEGDLAGVYHPLTGMTKETQQQLIDDHFLFKEGDRFLQAANACRYWPTGRGIYHNKEKTFLVWVNEEDHLRIISMQKGGDLKTVFGRLVRGARAIEAKVPFSRDDRLGFLTFCPTNLGTTIRASVHIKLPKLAADRKKLEEVAGRYNLQVRGTSGEHTESIGGVYDISNKRRLGLTEYQAVREMQDGILELIKIEKSL